MPTSSSHPHLRFASLAAYAGAGLFVILLAALHVVQPHMINDATISKYALGTAGWMLQCAFVAAGVAYAGVGRLLSGRPALLSWLAAAAFVVMGAFRIDAVGPNRIVSFHGAMHTGAFFVVVVLAHALMFARRSQTKASALRVLPYIGPVLVVMGFVWPGIVGALIFRAWTLTLVAWIVLLTRETEASRDLRSSRPAAPVIV